MPIRPALADLRMQVLQIEDVPALHQFGRINVPGRLPVTVHCRTLEGPREEGMDATAAVVGGCGGAFGCGSGGGGGRLKVAVATRERE